MRWSDYAIWWHVYPLGFLGAERAALPPGEPPRHRLPELANWLDHLLELGCNGLALGPVFAAETHGYDTVDHYRIDPRLGSEDDLAALVEKAAAKGVRVLLDGVFNHVGRSFARPDWFLREGGDVRTFEGHDQLVTLDHANPEVADYVTGVLDHWLDRGVSGWRFDAAYAVPLPFWRTVTDRARAKHPEAWFFGEVIHGDYPSYVTEGGFDSVTQYELWKAIWSSISDANLWELAWSLTRHDEFLESLAPQTFVGNHDTTRIASTVEDPRHRAHAVVVLCTVGGTPTVYAGDELGSTGVKEEREGGDDAVRPELAVDGPGDDDTPVLRVHQELIGLRRRHPWLHRARTTQVELTNTTFVYEVRDGDEVLTVALNLDDAPLAMPAGTPVACDDTTRGDRSAVAPHGWAVLESR